MIIPPLKKGGHGVRGILPRCLGVDKRGWGGVCSGEGFRTKGEVLRAVSFSKGFCASWEVIPTDRFAKSRRLPQRRICCRFDARSVPERRRSGSGSTPTPQPVCKQLLSIPRSALTPHRFSLGAGRQPKD